MSVKKPVPVISPPSGKTCPVCGQRSYSLSGTHPQCAGNQLDLLHQERLKAQPPPKAAKPAARVWNRNKRCPKCGLQLHIRVKVCKCGHNFFGR